MKSKRTIKEYILRNKKTNLYKGAFNDERDIGWAEGYTNKKVAKQIGGKEYNVKKVVTTITTEWKEFDV